MKLFKTTTLIAALATSFGAHAELQSLDDAAMTDISGQEGITIKMELGISNLDIGYHDDLSEDAKKNAATPSKTGGVLGLVGINTAGKTLSLTQTVDIVSKKDAEAASPGGPGITGLGADDAVLKMTISGIEGTFNVSSLRIGNSINNTLGTGTAVGATKPTATSLGGLVLGNLETTSGITQYIYAH